jgi:hypothetical protein
VASLALKKKWFGYPALWTTEAPCRVGLSGALPQFVLLSSEGVVLLVGTTESMELGYRSELVEEIEDHLRAQIELRRHGPHDLPATLASAWEAFSEGSIAQAFEQARALESDPTAAATLDAFRARIEKRLRRVAWQIENAYLLQAEAELARLEGQLLEEPFASRHAELEAALQADSRDAEWKAARDLAKLENKLYANGSKSVLVKQLAKLVERHAGTQSAERASFLLEAAQRSPYE